MSDWFRITNAAEVPSPALLIYPERVEENLRRMIARAGSADRLRPHVKTHKLPQLLALELAHGITKFKAATIAECEMCAASGARDVLLAYQPVGPNIARLVRLAQTFARCRFGCVVDNEETVTALSAATAAAGMELDVFLDLDVGMHRTGIAPGGEAAAVYRAIAHAPGLRAGGLHAYDGHLHDADHERLRQACEAAFAPVWRFLKELTAAGLAVPRVVASGTPTFPLLAQHSSVEVGAGTTVLWDFGQEQTSPDLDFLHAAVLMTRVISRPTPRRITLDLGHKAVASEMPQPRVRLFGLEDATPVMHSEEHLVLEAEEAGHYPVGAVLYGVPRHVCPTVALHSEVFAVRGGRVIETWPVVARARRLSI